MYDTIYNVGKYRLRWYVSLQLPLDLQAGDWSFSMTLSIVAQKAFSLKKLRRSGQLYYLDLEECVDRTDMTAHFPRHFIVYCTTNISARVLHSND